MTPKKQSIQIIDCTFRDGSHLNKGHFAPSLVKAAYHASSRAGVDYFEAGYRSSPQAYRRPEYGPWQFSSEEDLRQLTTNTSGSKLTVMMDVGKCSLNDFLDADTSAIAAIRVATYKETLPEAITIARGLIDKGYEVFINLMAISYYSDTEIINALKQLQKVKLSAVYFADSFGSFMPQTIMKIMKKFKDNTDHAIGFHAHNNIQMGFANTLTAIEHGARFVDGSIFGMGRGAGNLPLEILIAYLQNNGDEKYNVVPLLDIIDTDLNKLKQEIAWGYNLQTLVSGLWDSHPNYASYLFKRKEFCMEDIWNILHMLHAENSASYNEEKITAIVNRGYQTSEKLKDRPWISTSIIEEYTEGSKPKIPAKIGYRDQHKGKDILILASGPSIMTHEQELKAFINKHDPIVVGTNKVPGEFIPNYHMFINKRRFAEHINSVNSRSELLLSSDFSKDFIAEHTDRPFEYVFRTTSPDDTLNVDERGVIHSGYLTVGVFMILLAHVMGARRIFLAGLDGYTPGKQTHFYSEEYEPEDARIEAEKDRWNAESLKRVQDYLHSKNAEGFYIITPTNYKQHYRGITNYV